MLKHILNLATISVMGASVVILFLMVLSAMLSGGRILLEFNLFGEGWIEVIGLGLFMILSLIYIRKQINISSIEYCKRCASSLERTAPQSSDELQGEN